MSATKQLQLFDYSGCIELGNQNCKRRTQNKQCLKKNLSSPMCMKDGRHTAEEQPVLQTTLNG